MTGGKLANASIYELLRVRDLIVNKVTAGMELEEALKLSDYLALSGEERSYVLSKITFGGLSL